MNTADNQQQESAPGFDSSSDPTPPRIEQANPRISHLSQPENHIKAGTTKSKVVKAGWICLLLFYLTFVAGFVLPAYFNFGPSGLVQLIGSSAESVGELRFW